VATVHEQVSKVSWGPQLLHARCCMWGGATDWLCLSVHSSGVRQPWQTLVMGAVLVVPPEVRPCCREACVRGLTSHVDYTCKLLLGQH
jgi:hypothetical protein